MSPSPRTHRRAVTAVVVAFALVLGAGSASAEDSIKETRQKRENARNAQLTAARQINLLTAQDAEVRKALSTIEAAVTTQQARVEDGRRRLADAQAQLVAREQDLAAADAQLAAAARKAQAVLVERYVGQTVDVPLLVFAAADAEEALRKEAALDFVHGSHRDAVSGYQAARVDRDRARAGAEEALAETTRVRAELDAELTELQDRLAAQVSTRAELQKRLAQWRAEQDQLQKDEAELTELIQKRQLEVLKVTDAAAAAQSLKGFIMPAKGAFGSGFGPRVHPIFKETRPHNGVDIDAAMGSAAWAAKEGRVLYSGTMTGYGNVVILDHGNGVSTLYAHLSKILVNQGEAVKKGEVIGLVGATGWATGPHLHFEVRVGGAPRDPMLFLP